MQLLDHIAQVAFLLFVDGEHARQLVEHFTHGITTDAAERLVGLHDITSRVGDENGRSGMLEYRRGHAQVFFRTALLADVTAHPKHAFKALVIVPHQHQAQFDGDLAAIATQAVEQEQLVGSWLRSWASWAGSPMALLTRSIRL